VELSLALAFVAGAASFVTPCVLALVPIYLAVLADAAVGTRSTTAQAGLFALGFSLVFVVLGISVGLIGVVLFREPLVRQVAGVLVIGLGLLMTGVFGPVLDRLPNPVAAVAGPGGVSEMHASPGGAPWTLALGALVAIGWTPCIGPVLGAILALGASTQDVVAATLLLVAYAAGLAFPFLVVAIFLPRAKPVLGWLRARERPIRVVSGIAVIGIGVLIVLDAFTALAALFGEFFL
jgi:cytochrome c-type biogenesis protein